MKLTTRVYFIIAFFVICAVSAVAVMFAHQYLGNGISNKKKSNPIYTEISPQYAHVDVASLIAIHNQIELHEKRNKLIELVFGKNGPSAGPGVLTIKKGVTDPDYSDIGSLEMIDQLTFSMPNGIDSIIYYFHTNRSRSLKRRLAIYHEGHHGDFVHGKEMIRKLLGNGFDVMAIAMPLLGKNSRPVVMVPGVGAIYMKDHEWMRFLDSPIGYFMGPVKAAVDHAIGNEQYQDISAIGFSGGAWSVALYAAIDDRISSTYQIAGTMPFFLRSPVPEFHDGNTGDFEQSYVPLIKTANYLEIYVMGAVGPRRKQIQVINQFDSVAAHGVKYRLYDSVVRKRIDQIGSGGYFGVVLDKNNPSHSISEHTMDFVITDLNNGCGDAADIC